MSEDYVEIAQKLEKLHRLFLDTVKVELDRAGVFDISNVQALVLYNIGDASLSVGELTNRGYYLGSNVSYNLRKMVANNYIVQETSSHDKRSSHVKLSDKGKKLLKKLEQSFRTHADNFNGKKTDKDDLAHIKNSLNKLQGFWQSIV